MDHVFKWQIEVCWSALIKAGDISFIHNIAMMTDFKSSMIEQNQLTSLPCNQLRYEPPVLENYLSIYLSVYLSIRFYNSCRHLPETKRHSSLFLHWSGSKFLVVMAACTASIHVFLGRPLFLLSSGIHSIINFGIPSSGILLTWPYHCSPFFSMLSMMSGFPFTPIISFIRSFFVLSILDFFADLLSTTISVDKILFRKQGGNNLLSGQCYHGD